MYTAIVYDVLMTVYKDHRKIMEDDELVGINEIAVLAKVSKQVVANWRARAPRDFPKPIVELASGPVFRRSQVRAWLRKRKVPMAHVLSTINLKGGVAKTTTTVGVAEALSAEFGKNVLVIDLDPQTNATTMLIGEDKWKKLNANEHTLARLFKDALQPDNKQFDLDATLQKKVSDVGGARTIDLLPSSLDLIDVQDQLALTPSGKFYSNNPVELLWKAVKSRLDDYDVVLVDCPPNLGIITLNGIRISQSYIIPTVPDYLSTYGIPQIVTRVTDFASEIAEDIEPLGIVVTKYQANSAVHNNTVKRLQSSKDAPLFETRIRQANQVAAAAEFQPYKRTLKQKYGAKPNGLADDFVDLAGEIIKRLES
jgi:chromosome partitioning protein